MFAVKLLANLAVVTLFWMPSIFTFHNSHTTLGIIVESG